MRLIKLLVLAAIVYAAYQAFYQQPSRTKPGRKNDPYGFVQVPWITSAKPQEVLIMAPTQPG